MCPGGAVAVFVCHCDGGGGDGAGGAVGAAAGVGVEVHCVGHVEDCWVSFGSDRGVWYWLWVLTGRVRVSCSKLKDVG